MRVPLAFSPETESNVSNRARRLMMTFTKNATSGVENKVKREFE